MRIKGDPKRLKLPFWRRWPFPHDPPTWFLKKPTKLKGIRTLIPIPKPTFDEVTHGEPEFISDYFFKIPTRQSLPIWRAIPFPRRYSDFFIKTPRK